MSKLDIRLNESYREYENRLVKRIVQLNQLAKFHSFSLQKLVAKDVISEEVKNIIEGYLKIVEETFPNSWSIDYEFKYVYTDYQNEYGYNNYIENVYYLVKAIEVKFFYITIHFPETVITNSVGMSLTIRDLYVRLPISIKDNSVTHSDLEGITTTLSDHQVSAGYLHSHLHSVSYRNVRDSSIKYDFGRFCVGEGDIILVRSLLNGAPDNILMFNLYLESIKTLIIWESIEGNPYISMSTVTGYEYLSEASLAHTQRESKINDVVKRVIKNARLGKVIMNLDYKIDSDTNMYSVVDNEKFEKLLADSEVSYSEMYRKDAFGRYYIENLLSNDDYTTRMDDLKAFILFKGKKVFMKIDRSLNTKQDNSDLVKKYIHPNLKKYVKLKLEHTINEKAVENYILAKLNTTSY